MKKVIVLILISAFLFNCSEEESSSKNEPTCSTAATIKNLAGLDGCGYVFELQDGSRLEPSLIKFFCGTPPLPKEVTEDPLYNYEFVDGKKVLINYEVLKDVMSICMVGKPVRITCIQDAMTTQQENQ
jgi:hypothetical protein